MATFTDAKALASHQGSAFDATARTAKQEFRKLGEGRFRQARELVSGTLTPAQTKGAYARRSAYSLPGLPINRQTGRLWRSLKLVHRSSAYTVEDSVLFDPAVAGRSLYVLSEQGTRTMRPRGIQAALREGDGVRRREFERAFFQIQRRAFTTP